MDFDLGLQAKITITHLSSHFWSFVLQFNYCLLQYDVKHVNVEEPKSC